MNLNDTGNVTIVLLLISAGILLSLLCVTWDQTSQKASADTMYQKGQYIAVPGAWAESQDLIYVTDIIAGQLNVYTVDRNAGAIQMLDQVNLNQVFEVNE